MTATPPETAQQRRQRRINTLSAAARRKSEAKAKAAEAAIKRLVRDGAAVTFRAAQREAGMSHSFLYDHPILRRRIEHLRARQAPAGPRPVDRTASGKADGDQVVLVPTAEIARLKRAHREESLSVGSRERL